MDRKQCPTLSKSSLEGWVLKRTVFQRSEIPISDAQMTCFQENITPEQHSGTSLASSHVLLNIGAPSDSLKESGQTSNPTAVFTSLT